MIAGPDRNRPCSRALWEVESIINTGVRRENPRNDDPYMDVSSLESNGIQCDRRVARGDKVASRWSGTMTHKGSGTGVTTAGMVILVVRNGMIREAWNAADFLPC